MRLDTSKLVTAQELLNQLFAEHCRPKVRWLHEMKRKRRVPYYKIGHRVFFDPELVREYWQKKGIIRAA